MSLYVVPTPCCMSSYGLTLSCGHRSFYFVLGDCLKEPTDTSSWDKVSGVLKLLKIQNCCFFNKFFYV